VTGHYERQNALFSPQNQEAMKNLPIPHYTTYPISMKMTEGTKQLIAEVEAWCAENGVRFTDQRRLVLTIIAQSKTPIGAYDILAEFGRHFPNPKPPTIYRAIEFLQGNGFIHKIESLNAFVTCHAGHAHRGSQFIVCDGCGQVEEIHLCHLPGELQAKLKTSKFALAYWNAELHGRCLRCS
jgi:Fur family zinc uptake transcriptional regulator